MKTNCYQALDNTSLSCFGTSLPLILTRMLIVPHSLACMYCLLATLIFTRESFIESNSPMSLHIASMQLNPLEK